MFWHDDVIKWKHFPRYWPFVRGIHRSPANSPHKGQWRGALMFTLICARINDWINIGEAGDLRRNRAHYDVIVMETPGSSGVGVSRQCSKYSHLKRHGHTVLLICRMSFIIWPLWTFEICAFNKKGISILPGPKYVISCQLDMFLSKNMSHYDIYCNIWIIIWMSNCIPQFCFEILSNI